MSALDGFYSTWNKARETFGQGTPDDGSQFDGSSRLMQMKASVDAAAPDDRWQGSGSQAYAAANKEHASVYEKLAELDKKMAGEVKKAADVVTVGRSSLESHKGWVESMVNSVPAGLSAQEKETKLMSIAKVGIGNVENTVNTATTEMTTIKGNVDKLTGEYETLTKQKFGPDGEKKKEDAQMLTDDGQPATDEDAKQARDDVHAALAGDVQAAARVEEVLNGIHPGQPLSDKEGSYLSQMRAQQAGMSAEELHEAEKRLGDHKDIIANSWQLMSNEDIWFPKTETEPGALDDPRDRTQGGFNQLPQSVQEAIRNAEETSPGRGGNTLTHGDDLKLISDIVNDGNPALQAGTALDRELIQASDRIMDTQDNLSPPRDLQDVTQSIFGAVDNDYQAIHDHVTGRDGVDNKDFLHDITTIDWKDDGKAAGNLFSWTGKEAEGPNSAIAAETAEAYGRYIGEHDSTLLDQNDRTIGDINPHLVQGMAVGLTPYIPNIAGISEGKLPGFDVLDTGGDIEKGLMPVAKGIFSVMSSDDHASALFNGAAQHHAVLAQERFAADFINREPGLNAQSEALTDSSTLQGLVDAGLHNALMHEKLNGIALEEKVYKAKSDAFDMTKPVLGPLADQLGPSKVIGPGIDIFGQTMKEAIIGPPPTSAPTDSNGNYIAPDMAASAANAQVIGAFLDAGANSSFIPADWITHDANGEVRIKSFDVLASEMSEDGMTRKYPDLDYSEYNAKLGEAAESIMGERFANDVTSAITGRYNQVSEVLDPQTNQPETP